MDRVLTSKLTQARKHYPCDACYWWDRSGYGLDDCETSEQRLMVEAAQADKWRILPGQMYLKVTGVFEGAITTYRARPGMQAVLRELGLDED
jgi:hypothetical protein